MNSRAVQVGQVLQRGRTRYRVVNVDEQGRAYVQNVTNEQRAELRKRLERLLGSSSAEAREYARDALAELDRQTRTRR